MPASPASTSEPTPRTDASEREAVRIWIPLPVALLGVLLVLLAGLLVLGPGLAGSIVGLAFFGLLPGLAIVRLLGLHDAPLEIVLGIALSFAIAGLVSVTQAYFGGWSPAFTLGVLVAVTVAAVVARPVASVVRQRRRGPSDAATPVSAESDSPAPVAWPSVASTSARATSVSAEPSWPVGPVPAVRKPAAAARAAARLAPSPRSAAPPATVAPLAVPPASVAATAGVPTPAAPAEAVTAPPGPTAKPTPAAPARRTRRRSNASADLPPPPPVAVIRKRPKTALSEPLIGPAAEPRPSRAARAAIDQLVDDLADQREQSEP